MKPANLVRYLFGERRGMGSQLAPPDFHAEDAASRIDPYSFYAPGILISQDVLLADVSFWQAAINFSQMRDAGLAGVIIRAGQRNWVDTRWQENWQKARTAGIPRGSYWFYDSRETPKRQAEIWSGLIRDDMGELVHAADLEESYGGPYGRVEDFKSFINWFQDFTGLPDHRLAVYTGYYYWISRVGSDPFFRRFSLWLAWYGTMNVVRVPPPWAEADLLLWQWTSAGDGTRYGVGSKELDLNWFSGSPLDFDIRFGAGIPTPPPQGDEMYKGKTATIAKLWNTPGGTQIAQLPAGVEVTGDPPSGGYAYIRTPKTGYTKTQWLSGYRLVEGPTPPPPPDPEPEQPPAGEFPGRVGLTFDGTTIRWYVPE